MEARQVSGTHFTSQDLISYPVLADMTDAEKKAKKKAKKAAVKVQEETKKGLFLGLFSVCCSLTNTEVMDSRDPDLNE